MSQWDMRVDGVREAIAQAQWAHALALLDALPPDAPGAEVLELRALASYGAGEFEASIEAWEALHATLLEAGDELGAARAAGMVALYLMMDTGLMAPVRGWLRRADRLLEGLDGERADPVRAIVAAVRTYERFMSGDLDGAERAAADAVALGSRTGVAAASVIGRTAAARVRILRGDVDAGLAQLDEVGALLMSGGADPLTTGMMYCEVICAAQGLAMYDVAAEWTEVMERWRPGAAVGGINGRCRVHRAEVLRMSGPSAAAEEEALAACQHLRPWMRREFGWPLVELGTIRLRRGDLAGAEEAFLAAHRHAWNPQPGMALLRLARGDLAGAQAMITEAVAHPVDVPSKELPPFGDLRLAPLLDARAEIAAAGGDVAAVAAAAEELRAIAARYPSRALAASASLAGARAALLQGDAEAACAGAAAALHAWCAIDAPYEAACARVVLGHAQRLAGSEERALLEWRAAHDGFTAYGAAGRAAEVVHLLEGSPPSGRRPPPTPVDGAAGAEGAFLRDAGLRVASFAGSSVVVRDLVGLRYVERLLAEPGRELHVLDLVAVERGSLPTSRSGAAEGLHEGDAALPLLDDRARDAYRRRLADIDDDIDEAERLGDLGRLEKAQLDREYLVTELGRAVGLGGRLRRTGGGAERARTSVARSIRYAIDQLARHHPALAAHLRRGVRTGTYCCYEPDPLTPVAWRTRPG